MLFADLDRAGCLALHDVGVFGADPNLLRGKAGVAELQRDGGCQSRPREQRKIPRGGCRPSRHAHKWAFCGAGAHPCCQRHR